MSAAINVLLTERLKDMIVPKTEEGQTDWFGYIRTTWPIIIAVLSFAFYVGGRLESPETKVMRINNMILPLEKRLARMETETQSHFMQGGHVRMEVRMEMVERSFSKLEAKLDSVTSTLIDVNQTVKNNSRILQSVVVPSRDKSAGDGL